MLAADDQLDIVRPGLLRIYCGSFQFVVFSHDSRKSKQQSGHHLTGGEASRQTRSTVIAVARNVLDLIAKAR